MPRIPIVQEVKFQNVLIKSVFLKRLLIMEKKKRADVVTVLCKNRTMIDYRYCADLCFFVCVSIDSDSIFFKNSAGTGGPNARTPFKGCDGQTYKRNSEGMYTEFAKKHARSKQRLLLLTHQ